MIAKYLVGFVLICISQFAYGQTGQPICPNKDGNWHGCFGRSQSQVSLTTYVGQWGNNSRHGLGIEYGQSGSILKSGRWVSGELVEGFSLPTANYPLSGQLLGVITSSNLPACSETVSFWDNCFGRYKAVTGFVYVGEWSKNNRDGLGAEYTPSGSLYREGHWSKNELKESFPLNNTRFAFIGSASRPADPSPAGTITLERDRLTAEVEAERKKRQELDAQRLAEIEAERKKRQDLEQKLAEAEAKERERQQAQAPQPQRPQVALRNERRLALVIGNSSYKVSPLDNPANDANDVAESLKKFGFQTTLVRNATLGQMREATRKFADQLPSADVALIYFAGHGIESNRKNYMIPVNADLKFEYELADQGYDAGIWLEMLESIKSNNADRVNIVILDACRNNSLIGSRNLGRGLGKMDAPSGTFLAYSTAPGKVAADGGRGERNSPFTKHLIRAMQQPNQPIEEVFKEVRRNVGKETNGAQVPWESTSLTGFFTFRQGR